MTSATGRLAVVAECQEEPGPTRWSRTRCTSTEAGEAQRSRATMRTKSPGLAPASRTSTTIALVVDGTTRTARRTISRSSYRAASALRSVRAKTANSSPTWTPSFSEATARVYPGWKKGLSPRASARCPSAHRAACWPGSPRAGRTLIFMRRVSCLRP